MKRLSWEEYALRLAETAKLRSEDPFFQVGACALRADGSVASLGYNGPPPKINIDWSDRDQRRFRVSHAESNCLRYCKPGEVEILACSLSPCVDCLKQIASFSIKTVIYGQKYERDPLAFKIAEEFGIELRKIEIIS